MQQVGGCLQGGYAHMGGTCANLRQGRQEIHESNSYRLYRLPHLGDSGNNARSKEGLDLWLLLLPNGHVNA